MVYLHRAAASANGESSYYYLTSTVKSPVKIHRAYLFVVFLLEQGGDALLAVDVVDGLGEQGSHGQLGDLAGGLQQCMG